MIRNGNRTIKVSKAKLIDQILANKKQHLEEYAKAVVAYKEEALMQLEKLKAKANEGALDLYLQLVTPVDRSDHYDKAIEMFEWEIADEVELTQDEFKDYVQDQSSVIINAKLQNATYFNR